MNGTVVRFTTNNEGGTLPTDIFANRDYVVVNATTDTFQIAWSITGSPLNIVDNGVEPFYVHDNRYPGRLGLSFGNNSPVPLLGDGDDFSLSYYLKYHRNFDFGDSTGNKQIIIQSNSDISDRMYIIIQWSSAQVFVTFQTTTDTGNLGANLGGPFYMPVDEWVKFDWHIRISPDAPGERNGILQGWVNNELRWNYHDIATIHAGSYVSISNPIILSNRVPQGRHQERFWDLFRIGPGQMVLSEQINYVRE